MKRVTTSNKRFGRKDIKRWLLIILLHSFIFALYTMIFLTARHFTMDVTFFPDTIVTKTYVYMILIMGPLINAALHITYDEVGSPWTRFTMWVHSLFHMIAIPAIVFASL